MIEPEEEELEGEQWQEKINHEDQGELFTAAAETDPGTPASAENASDSGLAYPFGVSLNSDQEGAPAAEQSAETPLHEALIPRLRKFFENPVNRFGTLAVGLGVLVGMTVASITWYVNNPNGRYDLGPVTSDAVGLKGRLFVKWDKVLQYRVGFEPSYPDQNPGFSLAAGNPPRPVSISIQLRDVQGFELCSKEIVLHYDARRAAAFAPLTHGEDKAPGSDLANALANGLEEVHADAQETEREQGKDIFELEVGPNGQIASIHAKGELPCTRSNYEDATSWSFAPNFPSLSEQTELLKKLRERREEEENRVYEAANAHKPRIAKPAPNTVQFFIEGDDSIVDFDASSGNITSRGRKLFSIDKSGAEATLLKGSDFPMRIHYRCDQNGSCSLMSQGAGVLHARLRK
jgi:hypothetical protein